MKNHVLAGKRLAFLALVLGIAACMDRPLVQVDPETESYVTHEMTQVQFSGVDILVVVDDSRSMSEEQANLAANFPQLIQSLLNPPIDPATGQPEHVPVKDLHIGVVSTDMGTGGYNVETCSDPIDGKDGVLQHSPSPSMSGCAAAYPTYLSYASETPDEVAINQLATDFGCIATLGINGCGFEQQLKSAVRAIEHTHPGGPNAGFVRDTSILTVLFVTDEEDCSVKADPESQVIFDTTRTDLGHLNLRCFHHPYMVEPIETYVNAIRGLRADDDKLVIGFLIGVPQDPTCEGFGTDLGTCLDHPMMIEEIDPADPTRLRPSCNTSTGLAFPPRRLVQVAQQLGEQALVQSICTDNFGPAIQGLTDKLHEAVDQVSVSRELAFENVEGDPCRCEATCTIIEQLVDLRDCASVGKPCWDPEEDGICNINTDDDGVQHSMCIIPQAGTRIQSCDPAAPPPCNATGAVHVIDGSGWYYLGQSWVLEGQPASEAPQLLFTEGMEPEEGSNVFIQCESEICPENRQCGPLDNPTSVCCERDEYCQPDPMGVSVGTCVCRPDFDCS